MAEELTVIGKPGQHDKQLMAAITGRLDFAADNLLGKKLHGRILGSPYAHAMITSIDTSKAEALEGVEGILTYKDVTTYSYLPLFEELTRWGQAVAVVAATDPNIAAQAIELIDVEYEPLPFVIDAEESSAPGAPLVGVWPESNVRTTEVLRGDLDAGFAEADVILEDSVGWTKCFQHSTNETHSCVAWWLGDELYLWCSNQTPHLTRNQAAGRFGITQNNVHLITHGTGSACGDKYHGYGAITDCPATDFAPALAKKTGKPVQIHLSRYENYINATHQHPGKLEFKIGAKNDGTLTAIDATFYGDTGGNGHLWAGGLTLPIRMTWDCPDARFTAVDIATNNARMGWFRGVPDAPAVFLMHTALQMLAEELGIDPLEFMLKNLHPIEKVQPETQKPFSSFAVAECLQEAADAIDWNNNWHSPGTRTLPDGRLHGIGISGSVVYPGGLSSGAVGAIVNLTRDGTALINVGISRVGGGTSSAMCHIVAETLGIKYEDVNVGDWGNTDVCSDGGGQGGSTRTPTLGAAFQMAAEDAKTQLFATAAGMLNVAATDLDASEGIIFEKANPANSLTHAEVSAKTTGQVVGRGYTWPKELQRPVGNFPVGTPCEMRGMVATAVEVAVDSDTGEVEILKLVNACDVGRAISYSGCTNQIEGTIEIQINQALFAEQVLDQASGAILNPGFLDHKWTTSLDVYPDDRQQAVIVESIDACGPYGAKGMGEPPLSSYVSIHLAIQNATGQWFKTAPVHPWEILNALGKA
jgi:xanthine dehydrogenase molybdenum-binding subunit